MFYADQHMHSSVSFDSHSSRSDMAAAAAQAGLSALCFTDHYDVVDEHGTFVPHYDWAPAREAHAQAQKDWGDQLFLGFGIEVGNAPEDFSMAERIISEPGLDLVIGSIHNGSAALKHQVNESPCVKYLPSWKTRPASRKTGVPRSMVWMRCCN